MRSDDMEEMGGALSRARRAQRSAHIDLRPIASLQEAQDVQDFAVDAYRQSICGYTLAATSAVTARLLNCFDPVIGKLFSEEVLDSGATFCLPRSMLGVGAQFIFVIGSPLKEGPIALDTVRDAILSCHLGIQLLGRRVPHSAPLNDWSATADFGLAAGCVRGSVIEDWDGAELSGIEISLQLNHNVVARGIGADVLGNPIEAVLWLAQALNARGTGLQAGDIVAAGSCTGIAQVVPGQRVVASFGQLGDVELNLE